MAMMTVWAGVLVVCGVFLGIPKMAECDLHPLDMADSSVDDMYDGCKSEMENMVNNQYLANEKNANKNFGVAWAEAERHYNKKNKVMKGRKTRRPPNALGKERAMAIYVYTLEYPKVYLDFNNAVRALRSKYETGFKYHSLHFFLTDAVRTLNARKASGERCVTAYRRVNTAFRRNVLNTQIRFGSFTSASMGRYPSAEKFGDKSCFEISTCLGADVSLYSALGEAEREVLIPPYEVFKVIKEKTRSYEFELPCEVVYELKGTGQLSNLNCALLSSGQV